MARKPMSEEEKAALTARLAAGKQSKKKGEKTEKPKKAEKVEEIEETKQVEQEAAQISEEEALQEEVAQTSEAAPTPENTPKMYTEEQTQAMIEAAMAKAMAQKPQTMHITEDFVKILYLTTADMQNVASLGDYGTINNGSMFEVPKKEFGSKFATQSIIRKLLDKRRLIVLDGLSETERELYDVDYKDNEVLTMNVYNKFLNLSHEEILKIFSNLCVQHKEIMSRKIVSAYMEKRDNRVSIELIKLLSKEVRDTELDGIFDVVKTQMGDDFMSAE